MSAPDSAYGHLIEAMGPSHCASMPYTMLLDLAFPFQKWLYDCVVVGESLCWLRIISIIDQQPMDAERPGLRAGLGLAESSSWAALRLLLGSGFPGSMALSPALQITKLETLRGA